MPAKNALKRYAENGFYHIYNRGVAKNDIFFDSQDYAVFLSYLKEYLSPPPVITPEEFALLKNPYQRNNFSQDIKLLTYCLMPNHFHLLLRQTTPRAIEMFTRSILSRYCVYFNKRWERVGHVFQGVYKGILVTENEYLLWLSRYIHRNPIEIIAKSDPLSSYPYSSYAAYLGLTNPTWVERETVSNQVKNYQGFVENNQEEPPISPLLLE